jgi:hypothetical protein
MVQVREAMKVLPQVALVEPPVIAMEFVPQVASVAVGGSNVHSVPQETDLLVGQLIEGGVVSTTVTVWLHWFVRLQLSTICQVRVALNVSPQNPEEFVVVDTITKGPEAVGGLNVHGVPHSTVLLDAQMIVGGWASTVRVAQLVTVLHSPVARTQ